MRGVRGALGRAELRYRLGHDGLLRVPRRRRDDRLLAESEDAEPPPEAELEAGWESVWPCTTPLGTAEMYGGWAADAMSGEFPPFGPTRGHPDEAYKAARRAAHFARIPPRGAEGVAHPFYSSSPTPTRPR
jgi:hypothetical protein